MRKKLTVRSVFSMVPVTVAMSILFVTMTPLGAPETQKEQLNVYFKAKEIHTNFTMTLINPPNERHRVTQVCSFR